LYRLLLDLDANFRLKRRNVSNDTKNPRLGDDSSCFGPQKSYDDHLSTFSDVITDLWIEFCRSKARADRWTEEVLLLQAEKDRVQQFFLHSSNEWLKLGQGELQNVACVNLDPATVEGLRNYAFQQAETFSALYRKCDGMWSKIPQCSTSIQGLVDL